MNTNPHLLLVTHWQNLNLLVHVRVGPRSAICAVTSSSRFTSAPIVCRSDPSCQFIVEVDPSDEGVGAVLFQISETDQIVPTAQAGALVPLRLSH